MRRTKEPLIYSDAVDGIAAETYATIAHGAELYGVLPSELVAWVIRSLKKFAIADLRGRLAEHEHDADDAEGRLLRKAEGVAQDPAHNVISGDHKKSTHSLRGEHTKHTK